MHHASRFSALLVYVSITVLAHASVTGADRSLLVMTRPHADIAAFKERLAGRSLIVLRDVHCEKYGYAIFQVRPNRGDANAALESLHSSKDADLAVAEPTFDSGLAGCVPDIDDPGFNEQWNLESLNFDEMRCLLESHGVIQKTQPRVTLIDSGILAIKKEMNKSRIRAFNFVGGAGGVEEDVFVDGYSNRHGTAVASIAAAMTNNGKFLASPASCDKPVTITMCRVAENNDIATMDVLEAMTWCVDNQTIRGGPGVINMSVQSFGLPTFNGSSVVQEIAKSAYKQGDLFVNAAGNENLNDPSSVTKHFRVITGLDDTEMRWDDEDVGSNYGAYKAAAPCTEIPCLAPSAKAAFSIYHGTGTSFAAPSWASSIALLMSLKPNLSAPKADKIIFKTARKTAEGYRIPDLRDAVNKVLELEP